MLWRQIFLALDIQIQEAEADCIEQLKESSSRFKSLASHYAYTLVCIYTHRVVEQDLVAHVKSAAWLIFHSTIYSNCFVKYFDFVLKYVRHTREKKFWLFCWQAACFCKHKFQVNIYIKLYSRLQGGETLLFGQFLFNKFISALKR